MKDLILKNGLNNNFNSTTPPPPPPPPQYAVNEVLTTLFCLLAFLFLYACSSSDPSPAPPITTTYKVTFDLNKPNGVTATVSNLPAEQNVNEGNLATEPATPPTLDGYAFGGWYTDASTTTVFLFSTKITKATTLFAKWTPRQTFTITYHANKPSNAPEEATVTGVPENPVSISEGQTATAPTPPALTGYKFAEWYTEVEQINEFDFATAITKNIDLYAKWTIKKLTITYHDNKPSDAPQEATVTGVPDPVNIDYNQTTTVPTPPTLAGYNFVAWYTQATAINPFDFSQGITANIDLYAKWTQDPVVTFDTQEGSPIEPQTLTGTTKRATRPQDIPTRDNYIFDNWYTTAETGTTQFNFDQDITAQMTIVYARWTRVQRTITYHGNKPDDAPAGATITGLTTEPTTFQVNSGDTTTALSPAPALTGYNFVGWFTEVAGTNIFDFSTTTITANVDLYAKWSQGPLVTFNTQGGSIVKPQTLTATTTTATRPKDIPTRDNYIFDDWYTMATGGTLFDFSQTITAQKTTVFARWNRIQRTITYHGNKPDATPAGVSVNNLPDPVTVNSGDMGTKPVPAPELTGYNFAGWFTEVAGTNIFDFSSTTITENIDLYAKWSQDLVVTFDTQEGSVIEPQTLTGTTKRATRPQDNPTREDYRFDNWYTTAETGGQVVTFPYTVTENITLYARWTRIQRAITYRVNKPDAAPADATIFNIPTLATVNSGELGTEPTPKPVLKDYEFLGWFVGTTTGDILILDSNAFDFATTVIKENKDLYAKWKRIKVTITFHGNKPTSAPADASITGLTTDPTIVTVNSGETTTAPKPAPELTGYTFKGWYLGTISEGTLILQDTAFDFTTTTIRGENINLYAKWTKDPVVSFNTQGGSTVKPQTITAPTTMAARPTVNPTRNGYAFDNWYTMPTGGEVFDFSKTINSSITVYAQWKQKFTVTYHGNKPSNAPENASITGLTTDPTIVTINSGDRATPLSPALTGYNFAGWFTEVAGTNIFDFSSTTITKNIDLYAKWSQDLVVTFDTQGGSAVKPQTLTGTTKRAARPQDNPTREDYTFDEWYTMATGGTLFDFSQTITAQSTTVYAQWNRIIRTVTYHGNKPDTVPEGVSVSDLPDPATVNVDSGDTATKPATPPELQDYKFLGWFVGTTTGDAIALDSNAFEFETTAIKENKDLYAKWERIKVIVTFYGNKPDTAPTDASITGLTTDPTIVAVNSGETTTALTPPPELTGYTFKGWFIGTISEGTLALQDTTFDFTTTTIRGENINLYAKWTKDPVVTFDTQGGSTVKPQTITAPTTKAIRPTVNPTRIGYVFDDWYTMATGGEVFDFSRTINSSITVYARWTLLLTVTFRYNYLNTPDKQVRVKSGDKLDRNLANPLPDRSPHYTLIWHTDGTLTSPFDFENTVIYRGITVNAEWRRNVYTVTFNHNYGTNPTTTGKTNQQGLVAKPEIPTRTDSATKVFLNWYTKKMATDADTPFQFKDPVNGNIEIFARWGEGILFKFNTQGGSDVPTQPLVRGGLPTKPTEVPERADSAFSNWFTLPEGGTIYTFKTPITAETTIYAQYTPKPETKTALLAEIRKAIAAKGNDVDLNYIDTSLVNDMSRLFQGYSFNGNIAGWNVENVENMNQMFDTATAFNGDISNWNVHNVKNMSGMFSRATAFNGDISNWNVHNVKNMGGMFSDASAFNGDISRWNVHNVKNMNNMFFGASAFNGDISNWNVNKVTDMSYMFNNATAFNGNISNWNVQEVTNMQGMFWSATVFNGDISNWNVQEVTNMQRMFQVASAFNQDLSAWNIDKVTDMSYMFSLATAFTYSLEVWYVKKTVEKSNMFDGIYNYELPTWIGTTYTVTYKFDDTIVYTQKVGVDSRPTRLDTYVYPGYYNREWYTDKAKSQPVNFFTLYINEDTELYGNFKKIVKPATKQQLKQIVNAVITSDGNNADLNYIDTSAIDDMSELFSDRTSYNGNIELWNVSAVSNMSKMFINQSEFNGNIANWDVSNVTNMSEMFKNATKFGTDTRPFVNSPLPANINLWNVEKVTNMESMFEGATKFNNVINPWNVEKVTNMKNMFKGATDFGRFIIFSGQTRYSLPPADVGDWNVETVTNMEGMFEDANAFNSDITAWRPIALTTMVNMFKGATAFNKNINAWNIPSTVAKTDAFLNSGLAANLPSWATP